jgi:hypothetical protein
MHLGAESAMLRLLSPNFSQFLLPSGATSASSKSSSEANIAKFSLGPMFLSRPDIADLIAELLQPLLALISRQLASIPAWSHATCPAFFGRGRLVSQILHLYMKRNQRGFVIKLINIVLISYVSNILTYLYLLGMFYIVYVFPFDLLKCTIL